MFYPLCFLLTGKSLSTVRIVSIIHSFRVVSFRLVVILLFSFHIVDVCAHIFIHAIKSLSHTLTQLVSQSASQPESVYFISNQANNTHNNCFHRCYVILCYVWLFVCLLFVVFLFLSFFFIHFVRAICWCWINKCKTFQRQDEERERERKHNSMKWILLKFAHFCHSFSLLSFLCFIYCS